MWRVRKGNREGAKQQSQKRDKKEGSSPQHDIRLPIEIQLGDLGHEFLVFSLGAQGLGSSSNKQGREGGKISGVSERTK